MRWLAARGHVFWLRTVLVLALLACAGGVAWAVSWGSAVDAQRGGAVGVALSFLALFVARPISAKVLEDPAMEDRTPEGQARRVSLLRTAMAAQLDVQRHETRYLAFSSVVSTLVWGFGDWLALWLGAPP